MTDGTVTVNQGSYHAYYPQQPSDAFIGLIWDATPIISEARFHSTNTSARPRYFKVEYSTDDGTSWSQVHPTSWTGGATQYNTYDGQASNADEWQGMKFEPISANRWRFVFFGAVHNNGNQNAGMDEFEFTGFIFSQ